MKFKLLLIAFVFLLLQTTVGMVQAASNTFLCQYNNDDFLCEVKPYDEAIGCNPGYDSNSSYCAAFDDDPYSCNSAPQEACTGTQPPEALCSCISGVCTPSGDGELNCDDCNAANSCRVVEATRYKCPDPLLGCQLCEDPDDPECTWDEIACGNGCRPSTPFNKCIPSQGCVLCTDPSEEGCISQFVCQNTCSKQYDVASLVAGTCQAGNIQTAFGCIQFEFYNEVGKFFYTWGLGWTSGVAILLLIAGGVQIAMSSGDPRKLAGAKALIFAAISGVLLMVLSAFLLRVIGVDIIGLFS